MTRILTIGGVALALASGCATTREPDWQYSQPAYPPPACDPTQQYCPPPPGCAPGAYCEAYPYAPYEPGPAYEGAPLYVPPEAYGRGDRDEDEGFEHHHHRGVREGGEGHGYAVPAPPAGHGYAGPERPEAHEHAVPAPPRRGDREEGQEGERR